MVRDLLERVPGHHVTLWTDSQARFYANLGFEVDADVGMSLVAGDWLNRRRAE